MSTMARANTQGTVRADLPLANVIRVGLIGGIFALLVSLVGMVETFDKRFIISGLLTTGQALLMMIALGTGYVAAGRARKLGASAGLSSAYGAVAGGVVGALLALLVLLGSQFNLRDILANASPSLYEVLTFDRAAGSGAALLLGFGLLFGLIGALLYVMPDRLERALLLGLAAVALFGLLQDLLRLLLNRPRVEGFYDFIFANKGLTRAGAVFLFVLPFLARLGVGYLWGARPLRHASPACQHAAGVALGVHGARGALSSLSAPHLRHLSH